MQGVMSLPTSYLCLAVVYSLSLRVLLFCSPMDCSPSGSSVHGILQARILEWVPFPPRDPPESVLL